MKKKESLEHLRSQINEIDRQIVNLLGERAEYSKRVAKFKKKQNINVLQSNRENEVLKSVEQCSTEVGLDKEFSKQIFLLILEYSKKVQIKYLDK